MTHPTKQDLNVVIARRALRDPSSEVLIELVLYAPTKDPQSAHGDWACLLEVIHGDDLPTQVNSFGVDALQALINGIAAIRQHLGPMTSTLSWLGKPGEIGIPTMFHEEDPDFLALIGHVVNAEYRRKILLSKAIEKSKGIK